MKFFLFVLVFLYSFAAPLTAQTVDLTPITIIGDSISAQQETPFPGALEYLPAQSSAVDVQNRMGMGWLQDVSIRAGIFEDANVNLNGISLNNPQTGHFNLSLPGVTTDIESVDLDLNGQALGFQLVHPRREENYLLAASGSGGFFENTVSMTRRAGEGFHRFSVQGVRTDGLRNDTDGYRVAGSYLFSKNSPETDTLVYLAASEKHFGENGAYAAPWYMKEEEKLKQEFLTAQWTLHDEFDFAVKPYFHRTQDTFWLDRDNPAFYRNDHTTYVTGSVFELSDPADGRFVSFEVQRDHMRSTNLGERSRFFYSGEAGLKTQHYGRWSLAGSLTAKYFDVFPFEILPRIEAGYQLGNFWRLNARAERLYRQPSYTELYYNSASNQGNPDLNPQTSDNTEFGISYSAQGLHFNADVFYRHQKDTIDWVRDSGAVKYLAVNAGTVHVRGFDFGFEIERDLIIFDDINFSYTRLDVDKEKLYDVSKYVFDYLRDRAVLKLSARPQNWEYSLECVFEYHIDLGERWLFGARAAYRVNQDMKIFAAAENIFDEDYEEFPYIQGDPLFVKAGLELRF